VHNGLSGEQIRDLSCMWGMFHPKYHLIILHCLRLSQSAFHKTFFPFITTSTYKIHNIIDICVKWCNTYKKCCRYTDYLLVIHYRYKSKHTSCSRYLYVRRVRAAVVVRLRVPIEVTRSRDNVYSSPGTLSDHERFILAEVWLQYYYSTTTLLHAKLIEVWYSIIVLLQCLL
jgi:hypothetical protein